MTPTLTPLPETQRADQMLNFFKQAEPGKFPCTKPQAALIRQWWGALHWYDPEHEYTFNEAGDWIRKERRV